VLLEVFNGPCYHGEDPSGFVGSNDAWLMAYDSSGFFFCVGSNDAWLMAYDFIFFP
jgi:hypothetical protein